MKDFIQIYKEVQNEYKNKVGVDKIKDLKKRLMENIEKDAPKNEPVQYDRDKFLYYKVESNTYDINHVTIILTAVTAMLTVGALALSLINNIGDISTGMSFLIYFLTLIAVLICSSYVLRKKLLNKIEIAKKVSIILDEIDREIWQRKDN